MLTNHFPDGVRLTIAVFGVPVMGRCITILTSPNLSSNQPPPVLFLGHLDRETIAVLLKGHGIIANTRFKSRVAGVLAVLTAAKKRIEGECYAFDGILQGLRRHFG